MRAATPAANWLTATPQSGQASTNAVTLTLAVVTANLPVREVQQSTTLVISSTATAGTPASPVTVSVTISLDGGQYGRRTRDRVDRVTIRIGLVTSPPLNTFLAAQR